MADWLCDGDVSAMTGDQVKAYIYLLCHQGREGFLEESPTYLRQMLGIHANKWPHIWTKILSDKFPVDPDGKRRNNKLINALGTFRALSAAGKRGGRPKSGLKAPSKPDAVDQDQDQDTEQEYAADGSAVESVKQKGSVGWDEKNKRLTAPDEWKKKLSKDFVSEDSLTKDELKGEIRELTGWLNDRPGMRSKASRIDLRVRNWLRKSVKEKKLKEGRRRERDVAQSRSTPEPYKPKWCHDCRATLPAHEEWCKRSRKTDG